MSALTILPNPVGSSFDPIKIQPNAWKRKDKELVAALSELQYSRLVGYLRQELTGPYTQEQRSKLTRITRIMLWSLPPTMVGWAGGFLLTFFGAIAEPKSNLPMLLAGVALIAVFVAGVSTLICSMLTVRSLSKELFDMAVDMSPALISACKDHFPSVSVAAVNLNRERCTLTFKIKALSNKQAIAALASDLVPRSNSGSRARAPSGGGGGGGGSSGVPAASQSAYASGYIPSAPCEATFVNNDVENAMLPVAIAVPVGAGEGKSSAGGSGSSSKGGSFAGNAAGWGRQEKDRESDSSWGKREFAKVKEEEAKAAAKAGGKGKKGFFGK